MTDTSDRQTGKTTRVLLRALLAASEREQRVTVVVPSQNMAYYAFRRLCEFAEPIQNCLVMHVNLRLNLPNKSVIQVMSKDQACVGGNFLPGANGPVFFDEVELTSR